MNKKKLINDLKLIARFDKTFVNIERAYKSEIQIGNTTKRRISDNRLLQYHPRG